MEPLLRLVYFLILNSVEVPCPFSPVGLSWRTMSCGCVLFVRWDIFGRVASYSFPLELVCFLILISVEVESVPGSVGAFWTQRPRARATLTGCENFGYVPSYFRNGRMRCFLILNLVGVPWTFKFVKASLRTRSCGGASLMDLRRWESDRSFLIFRLGRLKIPSLVDMRRRDGRDREL